MKKHNSKSQDSFSATRQKFKNSKEYNPTITIKNESFSLKTIRQKNKH